jgi:SAM-dependent methyltransferase
VPYTSVLSGALGTVQAIASENYAQEVNFEQVTQWNESTLKRQMARMAYYTSQEPFISTWAGVKSHLGVPGEVVVEIGPWSGEDANELVDLGYQVFGVDVRSDLAPSPRYNQVLGNASATGLAGATSDFLYANRVLHHIADWGPVFSEWRRVMKPGSRGCATLLDRSGWSCSDEAVIEILMRERAIADVVETHPSTAVKLGKSLSEAGFVVETTQYFETKVVGAGAAGYASNVDTVIERGLISPAEQKALHVFKSSLLRGEGWATLKLGLVMFRSVSSTPVLVEFELGAMGDRTFQVFAENSGGSERTVEVLSGVGA